MYHNPRAHSARPAAPNERAAYQRALERCLLSLVSEEGGRALALFTSYTHLPRDGQLAAPTLENWGTSRYSRVVSCRLSWRQCAWIADDDLARFQKLTLPVGSVSLCALVRLPFDLPNFPLVAARAADYEDGFGAFSLPVAIRRMLAILRGAQMAAGERCAFVIADSRILRKRYGERFLDALPPVELRYGESADLGAVVGRWLQEGV